MNNIQDLSKQEQMHFIKCDCGEYIDMRNLGEVMEHQHWAKNSKPEWDYSIRIGEPIAYTSDGKKIKLN